MPPKEDETPSEEDKFFLQKYQETKASSIDKLDEVAKTFISMVGTLMTIYFAAVTFSNIRNMPTDFKFLAVTPIAVWILAIVSSAVALLPKKYYIVEDDPAEAKFFFYRSARHKYRWIIASGCFIFLGLVMLIVTLVVYIFDP